MSRGPSVVSAIRRAARIAPSLTRGIALTLLLAAVGTAGQVVVPIAVQRMLDVHILAADGIDSTGVLRLGGTAALALIAAVVATRVAMMRLIRAGTTGLAELRVAAFRHLHEVSVLHVQSERRGALVARVTSDIDAIMQFLEWGGVGMVVGSAQVTIVVGVMLVYEPRLAALVVVAAIVYALALLLFQRVLRRAFDRVRRRVAATLGAMGEAISGLPTIRAYGVEAQTLDRLDVALEEQRRTEFRTAALGATMFSSAEVFAATVTAGVVALGVSLGDPFVTAGQLVAFLFLVTLFIEPVQVLVEVLHEAQTAAAGIRRVLGVVDTPVDVADPGADGVDLPEGPISLTCHGVRFRYPTGGDVLRDLDLHLDAGARVAVVGETGSGKSTFVKLVTRLLDPTAGELRLAGIPLRQVRFASLRSRVVFVPQDGFLFDTTLADNVRYGAPRASDAEVRAAFADLGLEAWLDGLPSGLATRVGSRGSRLSSGERQLVALVRAWIAAPDLLVLDEATSAVDPELEVRLRAAIERLTAGRTSITVAHRLATAEAAERILVFDRGRIVEDGTHVQLVAAEGVYARMHADWSAGVSSA